VKKILAAGALLSGAAWLAHRRRLRRSRTFDLGGRVALVTGGSRGLGLLIARELAGRGCRVAICARDAQELDRARRILRTAGHHVLPLVADVGVSAQVEAAVRRIEEVWGPVEVLVNNASIIQVGPLATLTHQDFEAAMAANFGGSLNTVLAVLPTMRERGWGRVVNVTSIGGRVSVPHLLPYSCGKFAAVGLSEGLRAELAGTGVRVTTVVPGLMRTGSPVNALFKGDAEAEFTWFALVSSLRLTTVDPRWAARRVVDALQRGSAVVTLGWPARLAQLAHGVAPGLVSNALGVVNRMLPSAPADAGTDAVRGMELAAPLAPSWLTGAMNREARRNNEYGGSHRPTDAHAEAVGL